MWIARPKGRDKTSGKRIDDGPVNHSPSNSGLPTAVKLECSKLQGVQVIRQRGALLFEGQLQCPIWPWICVLTSPHVRYELQRTSGGSTWIRRPSEAPLMGLVHWSTEAL